MRNTTNLNRKTSRLSTKKKGQAAMEFLMTYGWAIIVVLAAIFALAFFGVLNPGGLLPERTVFPAPIQNLDNAVVSQEYVTLALTNLAGVRILLHQDIAATEDCGNIHGTPSVSINDGIWQTIPVGGIPILNGQRFKLRFTCEDLIGGDRVGDRFRSDVTLSYTNTESLLRRNHVGSIQARIVPTMPDNQFSSLSLNANNEVTVGEPFTITASGNHPSDIDSITIRVTGPNNYEDEDSCSSSPCELTNSYDDLGFYYYEATFESVDGEVRTLSGSSYRFEVVVEDPVDTPNIVFGFSFNPSLPKQNDDVTITVTATHTLGSPISSIAINVLDEGGSLVSSHECPGSPCEFIDSFDNDETYNVTALATAEDDFTRQSYRTLTVEKSHEAPDVQITDPGQNDEITDTETLLRVSTNVESLCKWGFGNPHFNDMTNEMDSTDNVWHTYLITGLNPQESPYTVRVGCQNLQDTTKITHRSVTFTVEEEPIESDFDFENCISNTGFEAYLGMPSFTVNDITLDGEPFLNPGDVIAVFANHEGGYLCAGRTIWREGTNTYNFAMAGNNMFDQNDNRGFESMELIKFGVLHNGQVYDYHQITATYSQDPSNQQGWLNSMPYVLQSLAISSNP